MIGITFYLLASAPTLAVPAPKPPSVSAPAPQTVPQWTEEIFISSDTDEANPTGGPLPIRDVWNYGSSSDWIPTSEFPNAMLQPGEVQTQVKLRLTVAADNSISQCSPLQVSFYDQAARKRVEGDQRLGPLGCNLLRKYARFRHAIDASGKPLAMEMITTIIFNRSVGGIPRAPMLPQSRGWVGSGRYDPEAWPPAYSTPRALLAEPKWKDFLAKAKDLPRSAATGVTLKIAADGTPGECTIGRSSGDPRIDAASCAALMASRFQFQRYRTSTPFLIRWSGRKAELVPAVEAAPPQLAGAVALTEADRPAGALPDRPVARLRVTIDPAGKPLRCVIAASNLEDAGDAASCSVAMTRARFTVPLNIFAEPSPGGINLRLDWQALSLVADRGY